MLVVMQVMSHGGEYQREWGLAGGEFFAQRGENLCIGGRRREGAGGVGGWLGRGG